MRKYHARFLEGRTTVRSSGYSADKMATVRSGEVDFPLEKPRL